MSEEEIRLDWDYALSLYELGEIGISQTIGWGFTVQDLMVLGFLYEAGKHRDSIIDLLEDCNFHSECSLLDKGMYDKYRSFIFQK